MLGKAGRANSATDPAPLEMFETVVNLKPEAQWRPGMTLEKLIDELDQAVKMPGMASSSWTMPIRAPDRYALYRHSDAGGDQGVWP